jgi:carbamoyltransferase
MNIMGFSGLNNSLRFKKREFPNLPSRYCRIAQGFDSAAALVDHSGVLAAAAEERFTGEKSTGAFPANAIQYCLRAGRLNPKDVDYIAHAFSYGPFKFLFAEEEYRRKQYEEVYSPEVQRRLLEKHFPVVNWNEKLVSVPHHLAHAASTFYLSGFNEALILISDGMGEFHSATLAVGEENGIKIIRQIPALHSVGILYGVITLYLGFEFALDEYKVMGLAPYGNPRRFFSKMMDLIHLKQDGTYTIPILYKNTTAEQIESYGETLRVVTDTFGAPREPGGEITGSHIDIAAALQAVLQECQLHVLRHFQRETGQDKLCLAGGVALNCTANGVIQRSRIFRKLFIQPAAGDDGSALGAALYVQKQHEPEQKNHRMGLPLWGPGFDDEEIRQVLENRRDCRNVYFSSFEELTREISRRLAQGQIVAWFQGCMEFGPRALGNRSILADPRDAGMRARINSLVKKREAFRPFAPVVTKEAAAHFFHIQAGEEDIYAYMLMVTQVRPAFREKLPAITHVNGSARVQTVDKRHNPHLWQLLTEFERLSGMPILLNTSFNVKGQPIVCTPEEALDTFLFAKMDVLVMGNYLVQAFCEPCRVESLDHSDGSAPGPFFRFKRD